MALTKTYASGKFIMEGLHFEYWAEILDEPDPSGIDGGRIVYLDMRMEDLIIVHYNRRWNRVPTTSFEKRAYKKVVEELTTDRKENL